MSESDIKKHLTGVRRILKQHPSIAVTFVYVLASAAGVTYSWVLFAQFGIDFFDYAELSDFALAAFRSGFITIWAIAWSLGLVGFALWMSSRKEATFTTKNTFGLVGVVMLFVIGGSAEQGWSDAASVRVRGSDIAVYLVPVAADTSSPALFSDESSLIGIVNETVFVFDRKTKATVAIPNARIHHIEYRR